MKKVIEESQQDRYSRNRLRLFLMGGTVFVVACIALIIGFIGFRIYTSDKIEVQVTYAPFAATVKIDDRTLKNNAKNYIKPGKYILNVELKDFKTITKEIEITESTTDLYGSLNPTNDTGVAYKKEHLKEFQTVEGVIGAAASKEGLSQREKWPIITKLPIKDPHYTLGYSVPDLDHLVINVYSSVAYRSLALNKLMSIISKEDLGLYGVEVKDLVNPYSAPVQNAETDPQTFIRRAFPNYSFTIGEGKKEDGYYYTYLRAQRDGGPEIFRVVLAPNDNDDGWHFAGVPYPFLTTANTPDVSVDILYKANQL